MAKRASSAETLMEVKVRACDLLMDKYKIYQEILEKVEAMDNPSKEEVDAYINEMLKAARPVLDKKLFDTEKCKMEDIRDNPPSLNEQQQEVAILRKKYEDAKATTTLLEYKHGVLSKELMELTHNLTAARKIELDLRVRYDTASQSMEECVAEKIEQVDKLFSRCR